MELGLILEYFVVTRLDRVTHRELAGLLFPEKCAAENDSKRV